MTTIIKCNNLSISLGKSLILDKISFSVKRGEVLGILGYNGAGKTILMNILLGLLKPTSGTISIFGLPLENNLTIIRQKINFTLSHSSLQLNMSPLENMVTYARLYSVPNFRESINHYSELIGISHLLRSNRKMYNFSSGERAKIALCKSLITSPEILLLDEPTSFLDPISKMLILKELKKVSAISKTTILIASHQLDDISSVANKIIILRKGSISYTGALIKPLRSMLRYY